MNRNLLKLILTGLILSGPIVIACPQEGWFSAKQVSEKVWQISDHGADNIWLIEGNDSSMLVDTGLGTADLASYVKKLTARPLIIVNTHGHPDHSGGNYQFAKVYMGAADSAAARQYISHEAREAASKNMVQGNGPAENELYKGKPFHTRLTAVSEGYVFDLGGRRIKVMETPGHTPGGICLLDIDNKLLVSGDNNNALVWLFLGNCNPLHEYLITLEKQLKRLPEFTVLFPGHGPSMTSDFIKDQVECVKGILNGTLESNPYKSFAGNSMISTYGKASVAFDPKNL